MVRLAGVMAIRYIGKAPKKLWEVGGRNVPILNRGDVVLVGETVALSLTRGRFFIPFEGDITMDIEPLEELAADENPPADSEGLQDHLAGTEPLNGIDIDTAFDVPVLDDAAAEVSEATEPANKKGK